MKLQVLAAAFVLGLIVGTVTVWRVASWKLDSCRAKMSATMMANQRANAAAQAPPWKPRLDQKRIKTGGEGVRRSNGIAARRTGAPERGDGRGE